MKTSLSFKIFFFLTLLINFACGKSYLSEQELIEYIAKPENGLSKEFNIQDTRVVLTYRPVELILQKNYSNEPEEIKDSIRSALDNYFYFLLKMTYQGQDFENKFAGDPIAYPNVISYFSYDFSNHISLTKGENSQPIPLADYAYIRTYNMTGTTSILLVFDKEALIDSDKITINIQDNEVGLGHLKFSFYTRDIENSPRLKPLI